MSPSSLPIDEQRFLTSIHSLSRDVAHARAYAKRAMKSGPPSVLFVDFSEVRAFIELDDSDAAHFNALGDAAGDIERASQYGTLAQLFDYEPALLPPHQLEFTGYLHHVMGATVRVERKREQEEIAQRVKETESAVDELLEAAGREGGWSSLREELEPVASHVLWALRPGWDRETWMRLRSLLRDSRVAAFHSRVDPDDLSQPDVDFRRALGKEIHRLRLLKRDSSGARLGNAQRDGAALELLHRVRLKPKYASATLITRSTTMVDVAERKLHKSKKHPHPPVVHVRAFAMATAALRKGHMDDLKQFAKTVESIRQTYGSLTGQDARAHDEPLRALGVREWWLEDRADKLRSRWTDYFAMSVVREEYSAAKEAEASQGAVPPEKGEIRELRSQLVGFLSRHERAVDLSVWSTRVDVLAISGSLLTESTEQLFDSDQEVRTDQGVPYELRFERAGPGRDLYEFVRGSSTVRWSDVSDRIRALTESLDADGTGAGDDAYERFLAAAFACATCGQWSNARTYCDHAFAASEESSLPRIPEASLLSAVAERKTYKPGLLDRAARIVANLRDAGREDDARLAVEMAANRVTRAEIAIRSRSPGGPSTDKFENDARSQLDKAKGLLRAEDPLRLWLLNSAVYFEYVLCDAPGGAGPDALTEAVADFEGFLTSRYGSLDEAVEALPAAALDTYYCAALAGVPVQVSRSRLASLHERARTSPALAPAERERMTDHAATADEAD
ncbi:MAG: hypothetical protein AAGK21_00025 [Bacteroidota bacterium]